MQTLTTLLGTLAMAVLILDPQLEDRVRSERQDSEKNKYDEVWEGVLVVAPIANNEHQRIVSKLTSILSSFVDWECGSQVLPGTNVSDRDSNWLTNYRVPDVAVYLATNPAKDSGTHWVGGPDLAVEIVSPGEDPRAKLDFYAKVQTRELLIVDRDPWNLELYRLEIGKLVSVGKSVAASGGILLSDVLPLSFELQEGVTRPMIRITHVATKQVWTA